MKVISYTLPVGVFATHFIDTAGSYRYGITGREPNEGESSWRTDGPCSVYISGSEEFKSLNFDVLISSTGTVALIDYTHPRGTWRKTL